MPREDVIRLTSLASVATPSRIRTIAYWVTTLIIASELALGGVWDILRTDYVRDVFERLGYPIYVAVVIGVPKVPAAVVLVLPRLARLKEWAYAGAVFTYMGAAASHIIVGDISFGLQAPGVFAVIALASWALRPPSRRDLTPRSGPRVWMPARTAARTRQPSHETSAPTST